MGVAENMQMVKPSLFIPNDMRAGLGREGSD